jgi:regulator of sigma E protease
MLVISAGVLMNLLFAFLVFSGAALVWGVTQSPPARLAPVAAADVPAGVQSLANVPAGARVTAVGGKEVEDWEDFGDALITADAGPREIRFADAPPVTVTLPEDDKARERLLRSLQPVSEPVVGAIMEGSAAATGGLRPGDRVASVAGEPVAAWHDMVRMVKTRPGQPLPVVVQRGQERVTLSITPRAELDTLADGRTRTIGRLGILPTSPPRSSPGFGGALAEGARETWGVVALVGGFLGDLVTGDESPRQLGGPILIGQLSGRVARAGLEAFLKFMALFSVNLAVLNLLPIPVLDGGHLMFLAVEAVRGRALSMEQKARLTQVGFVLVLALMVWALANDVLRLFGI